MCKSPKHFLYPHRILHGLISLALSEQDAKKVKSRRKFQKINSIEYSGCLRVSIQSIQGTKIDVGFL